MYQRFAQQLKRQRYDYPVRIALGVGQTSGEFFSAYEAPFVDAIERRRRKWAPLVEEALRKAHTLAEEDYT
jgi:hypothetical protein